LKKVLIIGSGFAGLSAATFMAKAGWQVTVVEKHSMPGGRARRFSAEGFTFDMGPSWYWMPDVFEHYFNSFGKKVSDYYELLRLDPSYRVYWKNQDFEIPSGREQVKALFEKTEPGAGKKLEDFLKEAAFKYDLGIHKLVQKPGRSLTEFIDIDLAKGMLKLDVFTSMQAHVHKYFKHPKLRQLMEFPVLFLGALAKDIPALYSLMNYADIELGTWYPRGGMYEIVNAMHSLAEEMGVTFRFNSEAKEIKVEGKEVKAVKIYDRKEDIIFELEADVIIGSADYHYIENKLLPPNARSYSDDYWAKRVMAPSCLLYFVGISKKLKNVLHHSLFFDVDFDQHGAEIYKDPQWPESPLFYVSATSVTDASSAPEGCENLFFLIPVAAGLSGDTEELRAKYFDKILRRFEEQTGEQIKNSITYYKSYSVSDFINDYGAFKGNAYGLANTLMQTANLKPSLKSKKLKNMYYTGQLTVPGPGVPPSLISGEVVAREIVREFKSKIMKHDPVIS
jgi:phytoene desaturase